MFEIYKTELKTYWEARCGSIHERLTTESTFFPCFDSETKAIDAAARKEMDSRNRKLDVEKNRFRNYNSTILNIRALWHSGIRKIINENENEIKRLRAELSEPINIVINRLPESFKVQGERLNIGSTIYLLNQDSLTWGEKIVIKEQLNISGWDNMLKATYLLNDESSTDSLLTSHIYRRKFYTNLADLKKEVAVAAKSEIDRLQNILEKTQE